MQYDWQFPLPRTHTGMLLGNGVMGVMIWGGANVLRITFNRGDFWDHRGAGTWTKDMHYPLISQLLEAGDKQGLMHAFAYTPPAPGQPARPTLLPLGRIELHFHAGCELTTGTLDFATGTATVHLRDGAGREREILLDLSMQDAMHEPILCIRHSSDDVLSEVKRVTCWEEPRVSEYLSQISFEQPVLIDEPGSEGWVQSRPAKGDNPLCVQWLRVSQAQVREIWLTLVYGEDVQSAQAHASDVLKKAALRGHGQLQRSSKQWWDAYWADVPKIDLPDAELRFLYEYGMYKFAGLTHPDGVASGLQGPWIEEYQMPPWSGDYHFNINVQMCYMPAYAGNRLSHLRPLFELVQSWLPTLRENARHFVGISDGVVLPHAVDDRCGIVGAFWTGTMDHACTGWVALMMYDCWAYGGEDEAFLREVAYPFLHGAMRVFEAMLERQPDGGFALPVSVSPEYRGAAMNAWGRNASFQLACIHKLIAALRHCCEVLNETPRPIWSEIEAGLPKACVEGEGPRRRIHLWSGTDLEESHRHHSHLGALTPFDVIDPDDPAWQQVAAQSIRHWIKQGMGLWSGWCMPWAAMLHSRVGHAEMAVMMLRIWQQVFTNEGHGTLHDCQFPGFTLMGAGASVSNGTPREIMQMEAGMGVTAAILDGMAYTQCGVIHLFRGCPAAWRDVSFERIRMRGAFLLSASRKDGEVLTIKVISERGESLALRNPWGGDAIVQRQDGTQDRCSGPVLNIATARGERLSIMPAPI